MRLSNYHTEHSKVPNSIVLAQSLLSITGDGLRLRTTASIALVVLTLLVPTAMTILAALVVPLLAMVVLAILAGPTTVVDISPLVIPANHIVSEHR